MDEHMKKMQSLGGVKRSSLQDTTQALRKVREQTLRYLFSLLFGQKQSVFGYESQSATGTKSAGTSSASSYSYYYYEEHETTCFDTSGTVKTSDGRELPFQISVEMSRSFTEMSETSINIGQPVVCDPLVINLDQNVAEVSDQKFFFDLDADVGAIYLGYENTEFSLNSATDNSTNAIIRKTGIFLYENGDCGTVQQLDLAT
jgi:hypothetical protein